MSYFEIVNLMYTSLCFLMSNHVNNFVISRTTVGIRNYYKKAKFKARITVFSMAVETHK